MHSPVPKLPAKMLPERSRTRRERRSEAARRPVLHVVAPGFEVAREAPRKGETITAFLRRTGWATRDPKYGWQFRKGLPTILEINGAAVLRKDWRRTKIAANDNVQFVSFPRGGGGKGGMKQVVGLVALVALAAFAAPLAGAALGAVGLSSSATLIGGLTLGQALTGALMLGGSLLISSLTAPKPGATNDPDAKIDQIYSVQAQGNAARLGQPLPVWYGRQKDFPDFAAAPWGEFVGNDQYLNVLLCTSMGKMWYEQLLVDDTPMWNPTDGVLPAFSSAQIKFYGPGETIDLFPVNIAQSSEVTGQQLPRGTPGAWLGPYVANPAGTTAYQLAIDFVFPAGCFTTDDDGNTIPFAVTLEAERQEVDDAGAPLGPWIALANATRTYGSRSPIRDTFLAGAPHGRYQVRFRRWTDVPADNKGAADVVWAGLRAYLVGGSSFPDVSTIAIRMKASESTQGSYRFGVIGTRILPVWNGSTFIDQATRNPLWAVLDMATNARYGSGHPISKVDFNAIVNQAAAADSRGDTFDYIFKAAVAAPEALDKALAVARSKHFWLGDTLSVVRDEWRDVPAMMLTDREIVRDSVKISASMLGPEDPDAVVIEYIDEATWRPASVQYPPDEPGGGGFVAVNAETRRLDGVSKRDHAYREAAFYYLQSLYRRELVDIGCEYEGRAITLGQTIRIQSELPMDYGRAGAVEDRDGNELTLRPVPVWADGEQHFVRLRRANGKSFGPVKVTKGEADNIAVIDAIDLAAVEAAQSITLEDVLARADGSEDPTFELGTADNQSRLVKVLGGQPSGDLCTLALVVDDERVHATDLGSPPVLPLPQFPTNGTLLLAGLSASFGQGVAEPVLRASWFPTAGAFFYRAEVSYDEGNSWIEVYQGVSASFEKVVTLGALTLRVQAVGQFPGPFSTVSVEAPTIEIMANSVAYNSLVDGLKDQVTTLLDDKFHEHGRKIAQLGSLVSEALARTSIDKRVVRSDIVASSDRAAAEISRVEQVAVDAEAAVANLEETVGAEFGPVKAQVIINTSAIATIDGYAASQWSVLTDVNGNVAGLVLFNEGASKTSFDVIANAFRVCWPGVAGGDHVPVFTIANVNGSAKLALRGDMLVDGTIVARMVQAGAITAVAIEAGSINTTKLAVNSVDINALIAGAATYLDVTYFGVPANPGAPAPDPAGSSAPMVVFFDKLITIRSGRALITLHSLFDNLVEAYDSSPTAYIHLYANETLYRSYSFQYAFNGASTWKLRQPINIGWVTAGLPDGSNRITLFCQNAQGLRDGQVTIMDLRR